MQNASAFPRFRQDLVAELVEENNQRYIDVADPDSGHMFRFFEVEYSLACGMNGERDVAGIVKWAQDELGFTPQPAEVQAVISQLSTLSFVGADRTIDAAATKVAAAQPKADELAKGVVVGRNANASQSPDVELGRAGTNAVSREEKLPAADFALGASGASSAKQQPKAPVEDITLGAPGAAEAPRKQPTTAPPATSDMSLDLADQFALKPGDVKEAVRQSKVMTAVEVPKELLDAEAKPTKPVESRAPVEAKPEPVKAPESVKAKEPEKKPEPVVAKPEPVKAKEPEKKPAEKKPVELSKPPVVEKQPVVPPAPEQGVSPLLISILILVVIGAGAFFVWKFVINKEETAQNTPPPKKDPPPPPPPAEATSNIVLETPPALDIKAPTAGAIETIEPADKDVKAGDVVATLVGAKAAQTELDKLATEIEKLKPAVDAAEQAHQAETQKENNEAGVKAAQAKLDRAKKPFNEKQTAQKTKQGELEKLVVKSPGDGKLAAAGDVALAVGDKVTADQVIAKVARPTAPVATFKIPSGAKIAADGTLSIKAGDKTVVCTVSDAQVETVKVTCPSDAGLTDGADVKFTLPK
jgi:biotin carboxyl carrier protein